MCNLGAEDVGDVFYGVVGILHHIVQQGGTDAGASQTNILAGNLCHGNGVHDVGFARESAHALVGLLCKVEGLVDDFCMLAVPRSQIGVHQFLVSLAYHPLVFLFPDAQFFHSFC